MRRLHVGVWMFLAAAALSALPVACLFSPQDYSGTGGGGAGGSATTTTDSSMGCDPKDRPVPNECQDEPVCNGSMWDTPSKPSTTKCGTDDQLNCDGAGTCVGCAGDPMKCGISTDCRVFICNDDGTCTEELLAPEATPMDVLQDTMVQTQGNCLVKRCDGKGALGDFPDTDDPTLDDNGCTQDVCQDNGQTSHEPVSRGNPCTTGANAGACDGNGNCESCGDGVKNGNETDADCGGLQCDKCAIGKVCDVDDDCNGKPCVDGVCCENDCSGLCRSCNWGEPGTCIVVPDGAQDDSCDGSKVCNGTSGSGACVDLGQNGAWQPQQPVGAPCVLVVNACHGDPKCIDGFCNLENGEACNPENAWLCISNHCENYQCKSCDVGQNNCDKGTCKDPGVCTMPPGNPCNDSVFCESGYCVDGVCCKDVCDTACYACSADKKDSGAESGTCGPSKVGVTDGLCVTMCDGNGMCQL